MDNYRFEKEYTIPADTLREGYRAFQKKYVLKKSYIFMALFLVLAADFIHAAFKSPDNYLCYLLIALCLAFAFREWYNPRRTRRSIVETAAAMGDPVYRISVADGYADISTVSSPPAVEAVTAEGEVESEPLPEPTRIPFDSEYSIDEHGDFFNLYYGRSIFFIVPKSGMTEGELEIMRSTGRASGSGEKTENN